MPNLNGTGPAGIGAGTGRGMGPCGAGMGFRGGIRRGRGIGWRRFWGYYPSFAITEKEETEILSEEASALEEELKTIRNRLAELKKQK